MSYSNPEIMAGMQEYVGNQLSLLAPIEKAWQPTDFLPDLTADDWRAQVEQFREAARCLPDEYLVVLVGNMITEEALPNYSVSFDKIAKTRTGTDDTPWAQWLRGWTAEENRHGDLLNAYLRLSGRVNMRSIETTIHHLITNGFNPRSDGDSYAGLVYTSFQERATKISHGNLGKLVSQRGEERLAKICQKIASDEARHEAFYTKVMGQIIERDPEGGVLAFRGMMRGMVAMPGRLMFDGTDPDLFDHFGAIAQRLGIYTVRTYGQIVDHLVKTWNIAGLNLTGKAAKAQDYLCKQAERYEYFADEVAERLGAIEPVTFSWLEGRRA